MMDITAPCIRTCIFAVLVLGLMSANVAARKLTSEKAVNLVECFPPECEGPTRLLFSNQNCQGTPYRYLQIMSEPNNTCINGEAILAQDHGLEYLTYATLACDLPVVKKLVNYFNICNVQDNSKSFILLPTYDAPHVPQTWVEPILSPAFNPSERICPSYDDCTVDGQEPLYIRYTFDGSKDTCDNTTWHQSTGFFRQDFVPSACYYSDQYSANIRFTCLGDNIYTRIYRGNGCENLYATITDSLTDCLGEFGSSEKWRCFVQDPTPPSETPVESPISAPKQADSPDLGATPESSSVPSDDEPDQSPNFEPDSSASTLHNTGIFILCLLALCML